MNDKKTKIFDSVVIFLAVALFFSLILYCYGKKGSNVPKEHSAYDSYTLAAMAWRRGEIKLDKNYPYLELAIINRDWLATHDKDDYMAYRETFGSRYTVDMIPGTFMMLLLLGRGICTNKRRRIVFYVISLMILIFGIYFNIYGAMKLM